MVANLVKLMDSLLNGRRRSMTFKIHLKHHDFLVIDFFRRLAHYTCLIEVVPLEHLHNFEQSSLLIIELELKGGSVRDFPIIVGIFILT